jgi:hypothetical protein
MPQRSLRLGRAAYLSERMWQKVALCLGERVFRFHPVGRDDAREGNRSASQFWFRAPSEVKRLREPALWAGGRLDTASARSSPARLALMPCAQASNVQYIGRPTATRV